MAKSEVRGAFSLRGILRNSEDLSFSRNRVACAINVFCVSKSLAVVSVIVVNAPSGVR